MANVEKMVPLNWEIMKNFGNWITVFLMVLFFLLAMEVIMTWILQTHDFQFLNENK
jgi:hypothetical protein